MKDITQITLGELLGFPDEIIRRNAMSILKQLQRRESDEADKPSKERQIPKRPRPE